MKIYIPGLAVISATEVTIKEDAAAPPTQPPTEPPPTQPPPDPGPPGYNPPVKPIDVAWPSSGQVQMRTSNMQPRETVIYRLIWKWGLDPNKFGMVSVVEAPGSAVMGHYLQAYVNGIRKFEGAHNDTGPQFSLCTAPSTGGLVQCKANDTLDVWITNGENNAGQPSNILTDFRLPDRY